MRDKSSRRITWRGLRRLPAITLMGLVFVSELSAQGTAKQYELAGSYSERTRGRVFGDSVVPHWFGPNDAHFWYRLTTAPDAHRFLLVNAKEGLRADAFDHERLAQALTSASGLSADPKRLELQGLRFAEDVSRCLFRFGSKAWSFQLPAGPLHEASGEFAAGSDFGLPSEPRIARSRDGTQRTPIRFENRLDRDLECFWVMGDGGLRSYGRISVGQVLEVQTFGGHAWLLQDDFSQPVASFVASMDESLAIIDATTRPPRPFRESARAGRDRSRDKSPDGQWRVVVEGGRCRVMSASEHSSEELSLAVPPDDHSGARRYEGRVWWAPNSRHFVVMCVEPGENRTIHLIESSPPDSIHARLLTVPYAKPGDRLDHPRPVLVSLDNGWTRHSIDDSEFANPFDLSELTWDSGSASFSFLYNERGHKRLRLIEVDTVSLRPRVVIDEQSDTFVCYSQKSFLHRVESANEWIWMSERDGWNHLYLIDALSGAVKNRITSGQWVVLTSRLYANLYEMAELGFVVVKIDGMGTSNRSKAFHDVCWKNLGDSGFPDRIAWIKAAAANRPEMDLSRVGIWGGSAGGQSAMRALIAHGDFYHAAVADCGCHDNRVDKISNS